MAKGIFTISLDFELYWGVRDHRTLDDYGLHIRNVHLIVPRLLALFDKYGVHCTWATVGFLFHPGKTELMAALPAELPSYASKAFDPYPYIQSSELEPTYHFAPALVSLIKQVKGQEIATHTYSHFYTLERNTTASQFQADLEMAISVAKQKGISINSIIFPRNQYAQEHLDVCRNLGITAYRGNEDSAYYKPVSREEQGNRRRAVRLLDTYINITGHHCHDVPEKADLVNIPASRFLRPYSRVLGFLEPLKYRRIALSMNCAAKYGRIYHLWWHPHNFGVNVDRNFQFLERILRKYKRLNDAGKMESLNMQEIRERTEIK